MDDRLLALSRARETFRERGISTAAQFREMDRATDARVAAQHGLVSRIVANGPPGRARGALDPPALVEVGLHPHDPHRLLYVGVGPLPLAAYADERRAWRLLVARVAAARYTPSGGDMHQLLQPDHRFADHRATALTRRGTAAVAILRAQECVRDLDAAGRAYLAPYAADLVVDLCTDAPPV